MTLSGDLPARNTLEHIPLDAKAVMIGNLGQAKQVRNAMMRRRSPHRSRRKTFFFIGFRIDSDIERYKTNTKSRKKKRPSPTGQP